MNQPRDDFPEYRNPRRGKANPEDMTNAFWAWCVKEGESGYTNNETFDGPSSCEAGPCWSFERFGQSKTTLPDGRTIFIAGEHEDGYDPDFYIYNDVVVVAPDGLITIFGYPEDLFPPTDFHSATQVGDEIILIGSLGYSGQRKENETQVLRLNLNDWSIRPQATSDPPGWISRHEAEHLPHPSRIRVSGFQRWTAEQDLFDDFSIWELNLESWQWSCVDKKNWRQFRFTREDGQGNDLFDLRHRLELEAMGLNMADFCLETSGMDEEIAQLLKEEEDRKEQLFQERDLTLLPDLYRPSLPHEVVPKPEANFDESCDDDEDEGSDDYNHHRIRVDGVEICVIENTWDVVMRVEGELPESVVDQIAREISGKLSAFEKVSYQCEELR